MARKLDEVKLEDGTRIPIAELTGPQCDEILTRVEKGFEPTFQDKLMVGKFIPEFALDMITHPVKLAELIKEKGLAPSEFAPVYDKAQEVNDFLYQTLQNYREKGGRLQDLANIITTMGGSEEPGST